MASPNEAVNQLRDKAKEFYTKGFEPLTEKRQANFHYFFQKRPTRTAIIDAKFDFDANPVNATKYLKQAVNGPDKEV
jgi:hypothetical protein